MEKPSASAAPGRDLWAVELGIEGRAWSHQWRGYARDSLEATDKARESLFGPGAGSVQANALKCKVLACSQVGR